MSALVISITNGDYEQLAAWRSHDVEDLHPISDGTHNISSAGDFDSDTSVAFDNTSTDVYTYLDNIPFVGATSGEDNVRQDGPDFDVGYVEVVFEDGTAVEAPDAVRGIIVNVQDGGLGFARGEVRMFLSDGTTEVTQGGGLHLEDRTVDNPGTLAVFFRRIMEAPGGSWSASETDGLIYRIGYSDALPITHWWDAMIDVLTHTDPGGQKTIVIVTEA